jgi:phage gp36-like protein
MSTMLFLMAQYNGKAVVPIEQVCKDYFSHLSLDKLLRKIASGEIQLPVVRSEASQKAAKGVHLTDLASYIEARREAAIKEQQQLAKAS